MKKIDNNILGYNMTNQKQLISSYASALKDENFKILVELLKVDDSILMKYTSLLEESALEYSNCQKCKSIFECKNKIEGYVYLPNFKNDTLSFNYKACKYQKELDKNTKYLDNIYVYDIPKEIKEASFKSIHQDDKNRIEVIKWLVKFLKDYDKNAAMKGLYLSGNFGSGKTYLIAALFNELAHKNVKSAIIFWPEYLRSLKANFKENYNDRYEYIKRVPLLLIDDIGAENMTAWGRDEVLSPILQYRMQEKLPTFFTSNLDMKSLEIHLATSKEKIDELKAERIIERIKQLTEPLVLISKNLRK